MAFQRENGTWSELFDRNALINSNPVIAVIAVYLVTSLLGFLVYPMVRLAFPGLQDRGYAFVKLVGMLLIAYLVWLTESSGYTNYQACDSHFNGCDWCSRDISIYNPKK